MKRFINVLMLMLASFSALAASNSNPGLTYGYIPTTAQWNSYFSAKLDYSPGPANSIPYWDASGNLLAAVVSGSCTSTAGVFNCATSNLTGGALGSLPYQTSGTTTGYLAGNTTTTPYFLTSTGTGAAAQAPTLTASTGSGSVVLASGVSGSGNAILSSSRAMGSDDPVINGSMVVAQAGTSGTFTAGGSTSATTYTIDMHYGWSTGANVGWAQVTGNDEFQNAIQYTGAASVTQIGHGFRIESKNVARFKNQAYVNIPVWISNSLLTSVTWTAYYVNSTDAFGTNGSGAKTQIATGTITLTAADTTLRQYVISFPGGANIGNGVSVEFTVGAQTSGTWTITGEDMFAASSAIATRSFRHIVYGDVLAKAQRYYRYKGLVAGNLSYLGASYLDANTIYFDVPFDSTSMRATPTPTMLGTANTDVAVYSTPFSAQTGFTFSPTMYGNSIRVIASKTSHGLTNSPSLYLGAPTALGGIALSARL